jgi:hypothetical protein
MLEVFVAFEFISSLILGGDTISTLVDVHFAVSCFMEYFFKGDPCITIMDLLTLFLLGQKGENTSLSFFLRIFGLKV